MPAPHPDFSEYEVPPWEMAFTATSLMDTVFPPVVYVVPGIIVPGLTLLVGPPKVGKSWLALNTACAVGGGGTALGSIPVGQSDVLYLALEDPPRRLQERLKVVLEGDPVPPGLHFATEWPLLHDGGADQLDQWLKSHPGAPVFVDVLAKVRGTTDHREDRYTADYRAMSLLKTVADAHNVAITVVHHTRKAAAEDYVDTVSGTNGLSGAADTIAVLARSRGSADATLNITGRDVPEAKLALSLKAGRWVLLDGPASDYDVSESRRRILNVLRARPGLKPKAIAESSGVDHDVVKQLVRKMVDSGDLDTDGAGSYTPSLHSLHSPVNGEQGEQSEHVERMALPTIGAIVTTMRPGAA